VRRRGFTLLEAMLALALTALVTVLAFSFLSTLAASQRVAKRAAEEQRSVGLFFDRLEDELAAAVAADPAAGAGVVGGPTSLQVLSRGVGIPTDPTLGEAAAREQLSDLRGIRFALAGNAITGSRWVGPTGGGGAAEPIVGGASGESGEPTGVAGLRFRYFDGKTWSETFNSAEANGLPVAVEVGVWTASGGPMKVTEEGTDLRAPDRWRLITIPDAAMVGWKEGARAE
jgi:prepilin-type N-terminal cleavage/methylation domain-containing protein